MSPGTSVIVCVRIYPLSIPLKRAFKHAAHTRSTADPVVMEVELADGTCGYGETLPRDYVTGETVPSVVETIRGTLLNLLLDLRPASFPEALEGIDALPFYDVAGEVIAAARAGLELALLDAYSRHFRRPISDAVGWLGLGGLGGGGSIGRVRYSGILSGDDPARLRWSVRKMRWFGLRDFKLKVGYPDDLDRIQRVIGVLGRSLGTATSLRLDANGAWSYDQAVATLWRVRDLPLACVEQPLAKGADAQLIQLNQALTIPLMHDESLITPDDAERLIEMGVADGFNIRISKNGGFLPSLRLAHLAGKHGAICQLGCMVGETSILSAAGRRFLEHVPKVRFAEGSYGRFLLGGDVVARPVRFGWGGRPHPLPGLGWGINVLTERLREFARPGVIELRL